jgi:oxygen-dependent protoporphyrinogen oxidase
LTLDADVAVLGAGIAGLAAAAEIARAGRSVVVLEASPRAGGAAWSERIDGHLVERGPNTFRIPAEIEAFVRTHRLEGMLVAAAPASRERFLLRDGALVPVPMSALGFARTRLLTPGGKRRLLAEPFVARGDAAGESVAAFAKRRFGSEACEALVGPFLTGVYAGDEAQLGAEAVFPRLVAAERRSGSVVLGLIRGALDPSAARGRPGTWSAREGVGSLAARLAHALGPALRLAAAASRIAFEEGAYSIEIAADSRLERLRCAGLVIATPAPAAADLVRALDPDAAAALAAIGYAPIASVSLSLPRGATRVPVRGFGFLVPRGEGDALLGCLFPSQLFADRAPAERELLTLLAGGVRRPDAVDRPDDRLVEALVQELDRALGLVETPRTLAITRWRHAVPQPGVDHVRTIASLRERLARFPRLAIAGAHADGVAFGEALASGVRAARHVLGGTG